MTTGLTNTPTALLVAELRDRLQHLPGAVLDTFDLDILSSMLLVTEDAIETDAPAVAEDIEAYIARWVPPSER